MDRRPTASGLPPPRYRAQVGTGGHTPSLADEMRFLAAIARRDSIYHHIERRTVRELWARPPCGVCGGHGVLGSAKAHLRCPDCGGLGYARERRRPRPRQRKPKWDVG